MFGGQRLINETFTNAAGLKYGHECVIFGEDRSDIRMWLLGIRLDTGIEATIRRDADNNQQGVMLFKAPNPFDEHERIVTKTTLPFHKARNIIRSGQHGSVSPTQLMRDLVCIITGEQNAVWAEHYCGVGVLPADCEFCRDLDVLMDIEYHEFSEEDPAEEIVWPD